MRPYLLTLLSATLLLTACQGRAGDGPLDVSVIGERWTEPTPAAALLTATSGGLVRLDREGQVIPGAAARWAILDDGVDYIFRIDDQAGLTAATIVRRLRAGLRRQARNPDFAALAPVESVTAVTTKVVEMRLSVPQPDLLPLLARPQLAVGSPTALHPTATSNAQILLGARAGEEAPPAVRLRTERVGRAVARFQANEGLAVLGGTFADLAVARVAQPRRDALRFDPASGLFGLAIRNSKLDPALRNALSLSIDRDRIVITFAAPGQAKATTVAGSTIEPDLEQRRATARALLAGTARQVRVAMPAGPGARLLFALLADDWRKVGVTAEAVAPGAAADLMLVDRVAPPGTLATLACALSAGCDPHDRLALINPPYIPIATPIRWSLVAPSLDLFTANSLAVHPLDQLRGRR
ncbi:ABC transporter substrate-binding protein [Sphingomonas crusticola]|uniref:ABC transporter substrate-binding protein n=1 Tax=Sphingomonas crusticola TaxID=1697973 RepID=UPI000E250CF6|nr:ABC transporter substrate-binding protein [Sphingomonas crusticola]